MGGDKAGDIIKRLHDNDKPLIAELTQLSKVVAERMQLPGYILPNDIAQDVWLALLNTLKSGKYRGEASVRTFVYSTAVRTCLHRARNLKRLTETDPEQLPDPSQQPDRGLMDSDKWRIAGQVVKALPQTCKRLWRLLFVEELDYRQAAIRLNVKEVTVRERMHSCCRRAAKMAQELERATKRG